MTLFFPYTWNQAKYKKFPSAMIIVEKILRNSQWEKEHGGAIKARE